MAKLTPAERAKRGKEIKPIRETAFKIWKENPKMTGAELRRRLGDLAKKIAPNTPQTWVNRWRRGEGLARTIKAIGPAVGTTEQQLGVAELEPKPTQPLTVANIADALLERVVEALTSYETVLDEVKELRPLKGQVIQLEADLRKACGEKDRLLKIHNDQAKRGEFSNTETLKRLAGVK